MNQYYINQIFNDDDGYINMFNACQDFYNDENNGYTYEQLFYSKVAMSNLDGGKSILAVFIPNLA